MKKSLLPLQSPSSSPIHGREALVKLLRWHFGHSDFRGKQLEAIEAVLSGRDCFCLMPTGGGKSLCYQVPALAKKAGIVLVVCPLIALMENQVAALKEKGIAAEYLSSTQAASVKTKIHEEIDSGKPSLRLLYVTPELIATSGFMSKLTKLHSRGLLNLVAIDEAHCISSWGHDFRPSYRKLSSLRKQLPGVPILALTATAVPKVQADVIESLCLQDPLVLKSSFNRPNIYYEVRYKDLLNDAYVDLSKRLKSEGNVCGIVYCNERTACDDLSAHLSQEGISCAAYHAGLNDKLRSYVLESWIASKIQVIVATVAFGYFIAFTFMISGPLLFNTLLGAVVASPELLNYWCFFRMGIDRKDVRIVCHFNIPKSMEAFYQESGRAGRDQLPSKSLLYYGIDDRKRMEFILRNANGKKLNVSDRQEGLSKKSVTDFHQVVEYCEGSGCRRKKILESFGEHVPASLCSKSCDACKRPSVVSKQLEELTSNCLGRGKSSSSQILMSSSTNKGQEGNFSEFWNRDDESGDSEDISDSDDDIEVIMAKSKLPSMSGLNKKLDFLQRAEENYDEGKSSGDQVKKLNKNGISDMLRESSKLRLQNALKQAQDRLGNNIKLQLDESATFLENECYNKYGKTGKSFYYSQVASTVRWLSTTNSGDLTDRLDSITSSTTKSENISLGPETLASASYVEMENIAEDFHNSIDSQTPMFEFPMEDNSPPEITPIPSFSEYINSKKLKANHSRSSTRQPNDRVEKNPTKKMKFP